MRVVLEIKESKALFFMELLNNFSFVKVQPVADEKRLHLPKTRKMKVKINEINDFTQGEVIKEDIFAETRGMWADRDIDIKKIRKERRERRTKYYDNATL